MAFKSVTINISKLAFDPKNPRLPIKAKNLGEESTLDFLLRNGNIVELMQSIAEIGYSSAEPLLVVYRQNEDKYIVVEGNRRLSALKLLNDPQSAKVRVKLVEQIVKEANYIPVEIPCILYDNREEILNYLGYRHITGIKEWGSLEKARYLRDLFREYVNSTSEIYKTLAKMIGSRSDYVEKLLTSYELYEFANNEAFFDSDIDEEDINFSYFTTALGYTSIAKFLGIVFDGATNHLTTLNIDNYKNVFNWLFDKKKRVVKEIRQISTLAKVIESDTAVQKLYEGVSLDIARLYTTEPAEVFISNLDSSIDSLNVAKSSIEQLSDVPENCDDRLQTIERMVRSIRGALEENFVHNNDGFKLSKNDYERIKDLLEQMKNEG